MSSVFVVVGYGDHRGLHVLTHALPPRLTTDLDGRDDLAAQYIPPRARRGPAQSDRGDRVLTHPRTNGLVSRPDGTRVGLGTAAIAQVGRRRGDGKIGRAHV